MVCGSVGSYSCKQLSAAFRPDVNFFATEVYGATFLLVALSWTGFWVDPRRHGGCGVAIRLGLGLFIVLILVVYGVGFRLLHNKVSSAMILSATVGRISSLFNFRSVVSFTRYYKIFRRSYGHAV